MAKERAYKSVTELLKGMGLPKEAVDPVKDRIEQSTIARELIVRRTKAGLSRKELAKKMGVTEKAVARIEEALNEKQTVGNIKAYAKALGYKVTLAFKEM